MKRHTLVTSIALALCCYTVIGFGGMCQTEFAAYNKAGAINAPQSVRDSLDACLRKAYKSMNCDAKFNDDAGSFTTQDCQDAFCYDSANVGNPSCMNYM